MTTMTEPQRRAYEAQLRDEAGHRIAEAPKLEFLIQELDAARAELKLLREFEKTVREAHDMELSCFGVDVAVASSLDELDAERAGLVSGEVTE